MVSKVQTAVTSTLAPRPLRADAPEFNPHASVTTEAKSSLLNATSTDQSIATAQLVAEMISTRDRGQIRQYDFGQSRGKSAPEPKRPPNAFQLFVQERRVNCAEMSSAQLATTLKAEWSAMEAATKASFERRAEDFKVV